MGESERTAVGRFSADDLHVRALVIFGIIMVFSASYYYSISQDGTARSINLRRQIMWVIAGSLRLWLLVRLLTIGDIGSSRSRF